MSGGEFIKRIETRELDKNVLRNLLRAARNAQERSQHAVSSSMRSNLPIKDKDIALNTICDVIVALLDELLGEER